jgi:hypothetical protein
MLYALADRERPCRSGHGVYIALQADLVRLGIGKRRGHDLRRTFISFAQEGDCNREALKEITRGSKGDIISDSTTFSWEKLREVVSCVRLELPPTAAKLHMITQQSFVFWGLGDHAGGEAAGSPIKARTPITCRARNVTSRST